MSSSVTPIQQPAVAAVVGLGPIFSDNVPQQITYTGQNFIELRLAPADFLAARAEVKGS